MADKLTPDQVRHVAKLSRLILTDAQIEQYAHQLSRILDYVSQLQELNLEGIEPMAHALDLTNVTRDDQPQPGMPVDLVLANAPDKDPPFFKVPKVLEEETGA